jgi:D-glycerate 3-kinase
VEGPLDLVLFEGWMLGFRPLGQDAAAAVDPNLAQVGAKCRQVVRVWVGSRN